MAANQIDSVVDQDDSIREEVEELLACNEAHPVSAGYLSTKGRTAGEWVASRPCGQMIFKSLDRVLWCVERTMLWQNPPSKDAPVAMGRPVNVLVAYPLAALLWVLQHLMFVGAEISSSSELIKWVQTRRRRLRAVRFQGIRNMRANHVLERPETSWFAQIFWFLGLLPADKVADVKPKKDSEDYEEEVVPAEDANSEQKKKRRFSAVSVTDDGTILLDDEEYNSEEDSDYVPEPDYSHSSESDSDLSSVDEEEQEDNLNASVTEEKDSESVTEKSLDKSVTDKSTDKSVTGKK